MKKTSRLLLIETIIPAGNEIHVGKFVDFIMLTNHGGRERTEEEYENLLQEAGFRLNKVVPTDSPFGMSIIEGVLDDRKL
jgi:O-methyltransferase domain